MLVSKEVAIASRLGVEVLRSHDCPLDSGNSPVPFQLAEDCFFLCDILGGNCCWRS